MDYHLRAAAGHSAPGSPPSHAREKEFLALGPIAEEFLTGAAASGDTKLTTEIGDILALRAAHGTGPLLAALERAVAFSRWSAAEMRTILVPHGHTQSPARRILHRNSRPGALG